MILVLCSDAVQLGDRYFIAVVQGSVEHASDGQSA